MMNTFFKYSAALIALIALIGCFQLPTLDQNETPDKPVFEINHYRVSFTALGEVRCYASDPDGDRVAFQFEISRGDSVIYRDWTTYYPCNSSASTLIGGTEGICLIRARVRDPMNAISPFSEYCTVEFGNVAPTIPLPIWGDTLAWADSTANFFAVSTDPEHDLISLRFNPGDGSPASDWITATGSPPTVSYSHVYRSVGNFLLTAQAKDSLGNTSDWSDSFLVAVRRNIIPAGRIVIDGGAFSLTMSTSYLYIAGSGNTLTILDASNPSMPSVASVLPVSGVSEGSICATNSVLYTTEPGAFWPSHPGNGLLHVFSISDPVSPQHVGQFEIWTAFAVDAKDFVAVVGSGWSICGCAWIEGTSSEDLSLRAYLEDANLGQIHTSVAVAPPYAYAIWNRSFGNTSSFIVISLSDSSSISVVHDAQWPGQGELCRGPNGYIFATMNSVLRTIQVNTPHQPAIANETAFMGTCKKIRFGYGYLGIVTQEGCLLLFDAAIPSAPVLVGQYQSDSPCEDVYFGPTHFYVSMGSGGLLVFNNP